MKRFLRFLPVLAAGVCLLPLSAAAQNFSQNFDNFAALTTGGNPWSFQNRSDSPAGGLNWFQGDPAIVAPQAGTGYVAANYLSTGGQTGAEHISNWLLSPTLNLTTGATITFFSRSAGNNPDRLELRLSVNAVSTNVGTTSSDVGDFTILLLAVNPLLLPTTNPASYPTTWTQYTAIVPAVAAGATGRVGFRYDVTNSGNAGVNGDYVGVDTLASTLSLVPEPTTTVLGVLALAGTAWLVVRRRGEAAQS